MRQRHVWRALAVVLAGSFSALTVLLLPSEPAAAHPLGNFSVNHYHGLHLSPDGLTDQAVIDEAEIPTLQRLAQVDTDQDGTATDAERAVYATTGCATIAAGLHTEVNNKPVRWNVRSAAFTYLPGAANLTTSRTQCELHADADLRAPSQVSFVDAQAHDRVGWHEITAAGSGLSLPDSAVPAQSVTDELRHYPADVLSSALDQRSVTLRTTPGGPARAQPRTAAIRQGTGPLNATLGTLNRHVTQLISTPRLTPIVGLLAIALALALGAAHAALPGHGKTVMAAYLAGQRGSTRDAIAIGATVTATHTAGVLILGLLLTSIAGLAGETLLGWLGVASGLLVAAIGATLLRSVLSINHHNSVQLAGFVGGHHPHSTHSHGHGHHDHHDTSHGRGDHSHPHAVESIQRPSRHGLIGLGVAGGLVPSPSALVVLLGAIALGRTWFGILLVLAYGIGMAAALILAGLALKYLHQRLESTVARRASHLSDRLNAVMPFLTAGLVLIVGLGLALRSLLPLLETTS